MAINLGTYICEVEVIIPCDLKKNVIDVHIEFCSKELPWL